MGNHVDVGAHVKESVVEAIGMSVANKTTWGGAVAGFFGYLSQVNWIGLAGVVIALCGLAANVYFQHRRDKREAVESAARIAALQDKCDV